jgi:hypothetical protein
MAFVLVSAVAFILYDSWLTPLSTVIAWSIGAGIVLSFAMATTRRYPLLGIACLFTMFILAMILPASSKSSRLAVINTTDAPLVVTISEAGGRRYKSLHLPPKGREEFIYFVGDDGEDITTAVTVSNLISMASWEMRMILTPGRKMEDLRISQIELGQQTTE